jgi:hypothetical protein
MAKQRTKIPNVDQLSAESKALYDAINDERELTCVLIASSYLDQCVASLLERFLISGDTTKALLAANGGALGNFSDRTDAAYCLGLIPKGIYQNLRKVAEIRNRFAHSYLSLSFDDPEIINLCHSLILPKLGGGRSMNAETGEWHDSTDWPQHFSVPSFRFKICAVLMAERLLGIGRSLEQRKREENGWN